MTRAYFKGEQCINWSTSNQFDEIFFLGAVGALVMFDYNDSNTFHSVEKWKSDIDKKCLLPDGRK
jgi:hypothetical protein